MITQYIPQALSLFLSLALLSSCSEASWETPDNKLYIKGTSAVETILMKNDDALGSISTAMVAPMEREVSVRYAPAPEMLAAYRAIYEAEAELLPAEHYRLPEPTSTIAVGAVEGTPVSIEFVGLKSLDRDKLYVLPISASTESGVELLRSASVRYFLIKGAALINVVANITENRLRLSKTPATALTNMSKLTAEALVKVDKFDRLISTIMGVEGRFLIRIGDAGVPPNQIQLATSSGNLTSSDWQLKPGVWTHVALSYDSQTGDVAVYIDGVKRGETQRLSAPRPLVDWGGSSFWVGYSYSDGRHIEGVISECRVWDRVLSPDEIASKDHFYSVDASSEGLLAYWRFDEGEGILVRDHTSSGFDLVATKPLVWVPVELPQ